MPLVRIELLGGRTREWIAILGAGVHAAMVEVLGVPERDQFRVVTEHDRDHLHFSPDYLDIERGDGFVCIQIVLAAGRSTELKQQFYRRVAEILGERCGLRPQDVMVSLVEVQRDCWSFGDGEAQYVVLPRERWR